MEKTRVDGELLANIHTNMESITKMLAFANSEWISEDLVYRFWHYSMKVYQLQEVTIEMNTVLKKLTPQSGAINPWFSEIVSTGTGKTFSLSVNDNWLENTKPIVDAFFHVKYMLTMAAKYGGELKSPPNILPSGWAALLELYCIR